MLQLASTNLRCNPGPCDLVLRLTAILLLLRPMGPWGVRPIILALAGLAIALPQVLRSPATWYALCASITFRIVMDWPLPDNHVYLLAYWCLAIALALGACDGIVILSRSTRLLIGFVFLLSVLWKGVLSPDYLDGRFFSVTLLDDPRFEDAVILFGGATPEQIRESRDWLHPLPEGAEWIEEPVLTMTASFRMLAMVATWGLLAIEAVLAMLFLAPNRGWCSFVQHIVLILFCAVTYAFAPVAGFGWLLLTMGIATCRPEQRVLRGTYLAIWGLVLFYDGVPWAAMLVEHLDKASTEFPGLSPGHPT